jgi:hypothetical protein
MFRFWMGLSLALADLRYTKTADITLCEGSIQGDAKFYPSRICQSLDGIMMIFDTRKSMIPPYTTTECDVRVLRVSVTWIRYLRS